MTTNSIREAQSRKITTALFIAQSLFSAAMIASFTLMPIIAADLANSDSAAGIPSTLGLIGRAALAYPIGWLMDRSGRRIGLATGFGFGVVGAAISVMGIMMGSFLIFCIGATLFGAGRASAEQSRYVAAEVYEPERRAKVIGLIVFAGTVGSVLGPSIVSLSTKVMGNLGLIENAGPFVLAFVFIFIAMLITFFFLYPDPLEIGKAFQEDTPEAREEAKSPIKMGEIFSKPLVQLALASMAIGQLVMVMIMTITPLHMNHNDHATASISFVIMAHTLGMFGLSSVTGALIDRFGRLPMIVVGGFVLIGASLMAPVSITVVWLSASLFLLGLGWNFCFIAGSSLLSDSLKPSERGRIQGASEVLVSLSAGVGSFSTGFIFENGGITAVSAVGLALSLLLLAWFTWHQISQRPKAAFS